MEKPFVPEWDYAKVMSNIKRWSFSSKMDIAQAHSYKYIKADGKEQKLHLAQPDEIETFVMLAVKKEEWKNDIIQKTDFERCITAIRNYNNPKLFSLKGTEFGDTYFPLAAATQFPSQKNYFLLFFRYLAYFTFQNDEIDVQQEFLRKFRIPYVDIAAPILALWIHLVRGDEQNIGQAFLWIIEHYSSAIELLSISRENYRKELDKYNNTEFDYRYSIRPSFSWPFIEEKGVRYCPTPHLLPISATSSLLFRLTENDDNLRSLIGKNAIETYLYKTICNSGLFDEVLPEQQYAIGKVTNRTLDVLSSIDDIIVCFDSKSLTPSVSMRVLDEHGVESTKDRLVQALKQVYTHTHEKYGKEYNPLKQHLQSDRENIYGFVVVLEDPYFSMDELYRRTADALRIDTTSDEYKWLTKHIGIVEMDNLEKQLFMSSRTHFIKLIQKHVNGENTTDFWFTHTDGKHVRYLPEHAKGFLETNVFGILDKMEVDGIKSPIHKL